MILNLSVRITLKIPGNATSFKLTLLQRFDKCLLNIFLLSIVTTNVCFNGYFTSFVLLCSSLISNSSSISSMLCSSCARNLISLSFCSLFLVIASSNSSSVSFRFKISSSFSWNSFWFSPGKSTTCLFKTSFWVFFVDG